MCNKEEMTKEWRLVPGWEKFAVSNCGDVFDIETKKLLHTTGRKPQVWLKIGPTFRTASPGRLVLEAFVGPCPNGMECCHYDDNPFNNHITNLRWGTDKDNALDKVRNGRGFLGDHHKPGDENPHSILTEEYVLEAKKLRSLDKKTWTWKKLGNRYGVSMYAIRLAVIGKNWKHLEKR